MYPRIFMMTTQTLVTNSIYYTVVSSKEETVARGNKVMTLSPNLRHPTAPATEPEVQCIYLIQCNLGCSAACLRLCVHMFVSTTELSRQTLSCSGYNLEVVAHTPKSSQLCPPVLSSLSQAQCGLAKDLQTDCQWCFSAPSATSSSLL